MDNSGTPNYDKYFNDPASPINNPTKQPGINFDAQFEVQTSRARISNLVQISGSATGQFTVGTGSALTFNVNIARSRNPSQINLNSTRNMGIANIAVYEGTIDHGSTQIYPSLGTSVPYNKFIAWGGPDWQRWSGSTSLSVFSVTIINSNAGTTANIFVVGQYQFIQNNSGTSN